MLRQSTRLWMVMFSACVPAGVTQVQKRPMKNCTPCAQTSATSGAEEEVEVEGSRKREREGGFEGEERRGEAGAR